MVKANPDASNPPIAQQNRNKPREAKTLIAEKEAQHDNEYYDQIMFNSFIKLRLNVATNCNIT